MQLAIRTNSHNIQHLFVSGKLLEDTGTRHSRALFYNKNGFLPPVQKYVSVVEKGII